MTTMKRKMMKREIEQMVRSMTGLQKMKTNTIRKCRHTKKVRSIQYQINKAVRISLLFR